MAVPAQRTNTWILDEWYDQAVAGTTGGYSGDPKFYTWGNNGNGQLGQNSRQALSSPTQLPGQWTGIFASNDGEGVNGGVKSDGTMWVSGFNGQGQLGVNDTAHRSSPVQIPGTTWSTGQLRTGNYRTMAVKTDGTLWTWGKSNMGELGHNNVVKYSSPTQVGTDTTWSSAAEKQATGGNMSAAIKTDGTLWTWGEQSYGSLGLNSETPPGQSSPCQVGGNTNWKVISVFNQGMVAVKTDGTLWGWGANDNGEMGLNAPMNATYSSPKQIGGGSSDWDTVRTTSAGFVLAKKTNGSLWSWGYNTFGWSGTNDTIVRSSPIQLGTDTNWDNIQGTSGALMKVTKTDGTLWLWGRNSFGGAIQDPTPSPTFRPGYSSPTQVPGTWSNLVGGTAYGVSVITPSN